MISVLSAKVPNRPLEWTGRLRFFYSIPSSQPATQGQR